jgi:hypothetical protein
MADVAVSLQDGLYPRKLHDNGDGTFSDTAYLTGGGTGGGAVTIADGADVAEGAKADAAYTGSGSASLVAIAKGQYAALTIGTNYEAVAASQTNQVLGGAGATGDLLVGLLVVPASTSPGAISIKDGSATAITVFAGGASSVSNLVSFFVPLNIKSTGGAWQVTTGTNISVIGVGSFT